MSGAEDTRLSGGYQRRADFRSSASERRRQYEEDELRGLWLSRLMFGWMVGMSEDRSYEEWLEAVLAARSRERG